MGKSARNEFLAKYYLRAAGVAAVWIDADGHVGARDVGQSRHQLVDVDRLVGWLRGRCRRLKLDATDEALELDIPHIRPRGRLRQPPGREPARRRPAPG